MRRPPMSSSAHARSGVDAIFVCVLAIAGVAVLVGLDLWLALWASVVLTHGPGAMRATPGAMQGAGALMRGLMSSAGAPYSGYPGLAAASAPPGALFWALAVMIAAAGGPPLALSGLWIVRWVQGGHRSPRSHGMGRWASLRDLRRVCQVVPVHRLAAVGIVLGFWGRRVLMSGLETSVLVLGVNRSGKTTTLVIPTLVAWRSGGVLATSTKRELPRITGPYRAGLGLGRVSVFAPLEEDQAWIRDLGLEVATWNPISDVSSAGGAAELVDLLTAEGRHAASDPMWINEAAALLLGLVLAEREALADGRRGGDLTAVRARLLETRVAEYAGLAMSVRDPEAKQIFAAFSRTPEATAGGIITTARACLTLWTDQRVAAATAAGGGGPDVMRLLIDGGTLYLVAPLEDAERCRPLFTALVQSILRSALAEAQRSPDGVLPRRLLLAIDEAGNFVRMPRLASYLATGPGHGVNFLLCYQDLAQIEDAYGVIAARTIVNNCRARLLLPNQGDPQSLELFSRGAGQATTVFEAPAWNAAGERSISEQRTGTALAPPEMLAALEDDERMLIYAKAPALVRGRPYFAVRPWASALESARPRRGAPPAAPADDPGEPPVRSPFGRAAARDLQPVRSPLDRDQSIHQR